MRKSGRDRRVTKRRKGWRGHNKAERDGEAIRGGGDQS